MSVYLDGTSVLLDTGKVATDAACCCITCDCSPGVSVEISVHATASGDGCATLDVTDSLSFSQPAGFGFYDFTTAHNCLAGCTFSPTAYGRVVYVGNVTCLEGGALQIFIQAISACCYVPGVGGCNNFQGCNCGSVSGGNQIITCSGVYHFNFNNCGGLDPSCSLDVTVTVTIP